MTNVNGRKRDVGKVKRNWTNRRVKGFRKIMEQKTRQMCKSEKIRPKKVKVIGTKLKVKGKLCNKFDSGGKWDQRTK